MVSTMWPETEMEFVESADGMAEGRADLRAETSWSRTGVTGGLDVDFLAATRRALDGTVGGPTESLSSRERFRAFPRSGK
jgi:hypothetical protein